MGPRHLKRVPLHVWVLALTLPFLVGFTVTTLVLVASAQ